MFCLIVTDRATKFLTLSDIISSQLKSQRQETNIHFKHNNPVYEVLFEVN